MRRLPTLAVIALSVLTGALVALLLYKQAWRIPVVQDLRGTRLFCALWVLAMPVCATVLALARAARWSTALKGAAICLGIAAPAYGIGTSFDKVRTASQQKAVLCNLRQLAAAADQYFLENGVRSVARIEELVGPTKYIKALNRIAGEDYAANFPFKQDDILTAEFPSGLMLNYASDPLPADYKHVFEPGEIPSWRKVRKTSPASDANLMPYLATEPGAAATVNFPPPAAPQVASTNDRVILRELGQPKHKVHRGTMCASCHAKRT